MEGYLGEFPVNFRESPFRNYTAENWALYFIESYGQIDGDHHKAWLLDQVARILLGTEVIVTEARWENGTKEFRVTLKPPVTGYHFWVSKMRGRLEDGVYEYDYNEGIAP